MPKVILAKVLSKRTWSLRAILSKILFGIYAILWHSFQIERNIYINKIFWKYKKSFIWLQILRCLYLLLLPKHPSKTDEESRSISSPISSSLIPSCLSPATNSRPQPQGSALAASTASTKKEWGSYCCFLSQCHFRLKALENRLVFA